MRGEKQLNNSSFRGKLQKENAQMEAGDWATLQQICDFGRILRQEKFEVVPEAADKEMGTEWAEAEAPPWSYWGGGEHHKKRKTRADCTSEASVWDSWVIPIVELCEEGEFRFREGVKVDHPKPCSHQLEHTFTTGHTEIWNRRAQWFKAALWC